MIWEALFTHFCGKGLPESFLKHVCISQIDAQEILKRIQFKDPRAVLEIGTSVGLSTGVIASALSHGAKLVCVDPNIPIAFHKWIGSGEYFCSDMTRAFEHVKEVLRFVNPNLEVQLIPGTFSSAFSAKVASLLALKGFSLEEVPIVGNKVRVYGPYDMVFVDGDHSSAAVESDLNLISQSLAADGEILLHDVNDSWGTGVLLGIDNFVSRHSDFTLTRLEGNIGIVSRKKVI